MKGFLFISSNLFLCSKKTFTLNRFNTVSCLICHQKSSLFWMMYHQKIFFLFQHHDQYILHYNCPVRYHWKLEIGVYKESIHIAMIFHCGHCDNIYQNSSIMNKSFNLEGLIIKKIIIVIEFSFSKQFLKSSIDDN